MSGRKLSHPPVPVLSVLGAVLDALNSDGRFKSVPNGRMEIAWKQATKGRNGEGDRPERYAATVEFAYVPKDDGA